MCRNAPTGDLWEGSRDGGGDAADSKARGDAFGAVEGLPPSFLRECIRVLEMAGVGARAASSQRSARSGGGGGGGGEALRLAELLGAGAEDAGDSEATAAVWAPREAEHLVRLSSYPPELGMGAVCACALGRDAGTCASICSCFRLPN